LDVLVDSYFPHLDRFQSLLDQLEEQIVARPSGTGIAHLHDVRTDLVRLRNDLRPQRDIFGVLSRLEVPLFRKEMRNYLRDVQDHMISVLDTLDAYREITGSLMEVQATLVSNQSNEVIKVLTVIFTITLPIAIVSSAFGMNVAFFGFNAAEGLYLALLLMGAPTGILAWWMHRTARADGPARHANREGAADPRRHVPRDGCGETGLPGRVVRHRGEPVRVPGLRESGDRCEGSVSRAPAERADRGRSLEHRGQGHRHRCGRRTDARVRGAG